MQSSEDEKWAPLEGESGELADLLEFKVVPRTKNAVEWLRGCSSDASLPQWEEFRAALLLLRTDVIPLLDDWVGMLRLLVPAIPPEFFTAQGIDSPLFALIPESAVALGETAVFCYRRVATRASSEFGRRKELKELLLDAREAFGLTVAFVTSANVFLQGQVFDDLLAVRNRRLLYQVPRKERPTARQYLQRLEETSRRTEAARRRLAALERLRQNQPSSQSE